MDPTNNPTPNPNPAPTPDAASAPEPVTSAPAEPAAPAGPTPATAAGGMTTPPVNPIINPTGNATSQPEGLAATDPIMRPEPAPEPDPVEEELKAPMVAAEPAPGSIGSAVSGPTAGASVEETPATNPFAEDKQTPNVAFNDPATQPDVAAGGMAPAANATKKKSNKTTLIALIAVAAVIVVALVVVLVMQLTTGQGGTQANNTPNNPVVIDEEDEDNTTTGGNTNTNGGNTSGTAVAGTLSCARNMTPAEIARFNDAASGTISVSASFGSEDMLETISLVESVVYNDEDATDNEPVEETIHEATGADIDAKSASIYYLSANSEGELDLSQAGIQANYEALDFVCEVL